MVYKAVRGMEDILPKDVHLWQWLERVAKRELEYYGYEEIRTPIVEDTALFARSIGEGTDIVSKEMYSFKDKKERSLTLRPEGTAPIVRSYVEHSLDKISPEINLYYIGPMFRSERPQKGRKRQFHQIGVERFGNGTYHTDALVIQQLYHMLKAGFGLDGFEIKLNSLGCKKDKANFEEKLKKNIAKDPSKLCSDCRERAKRNVLRVLDCKKESCKQFLLKAPSVLDSLCSDCKEHFNGLKAALKAMNIDFTETKNLVRGLDYYTGTVFEITHPALGAQDAIGAGGRYDDLVKDFGGLKIDAIGYALGIERLVIALKDTKKIPKPKTIYVAGIGSIGSEPIVKAGIIAETLRMALGRQGGMHIRVITGTKISSLKAQLKSADKAGAEIVIILGDDEISSGELTLKDMVKKEQIKVSSDPSDELIKAIKKRIE
ncbi:MAG: histidine--tRNA ligase [Candidatus Omnitrophota bacterium]